MARTKKYLSSKSTKKFKKGFYRPIKRIQKTDAKSTKAKTAPKETPLKTEDELAAQLLEVKDLKAQLEEKLALKNTDSPDTEPPSISSSINPEDMAINLFDDLKDDQSKPLTDSEDDPRTTEDKDEDIDFSSHDEKEKVDLLEKQLDHKNSQKAKAQRELDKLKSEFENERKAMQRQLSILRKDMHREEPITHNKFFSLSKELGQVVEQMDKLVSSPSFTQATTRVEAVKVTEVIKPTRPELTSKPFENKIKKAEIISQQEVIKADQPQPELEPSPQPQTTSAEKPRKKRKIPKIIMVMGTTMTIVLILVGVVWFSVNKRSNISDQLLQEYLPEDSGENPSTQDWEKKIDQIIEEAFTGKPAEETDDSKVKGDSDTKYAESQADVAFSETYWDTLTDPSIGMEINYPKNTVNFIKTETSLTFIRKSGYIFKVQIIESALDLPEYWKMIKASSLNYKVKETTFRDQQALFLELEDFAQYPGDKYLVKKGDYIYDIWYATFSNALSDDDAKRIDIMLNSFKFIEKVI